MKKGLIRTGLILLIVLINIGCDQQTKQMAKRHLDPSEEVSYLNNIFKLTYVENTGAFLSIGAGFSNKMRYWVLKIFPVILLSGLLVYTLFSGSLNTWSIVAFSFILGGGISNIYDRLLYNGVIDFMNLGIGNLRTGIFNFADVSIMIGLFMMLPTLFRKPAAEKS